MYKHCGGKVLYSGKVESMEDYSRNTVEEKYSGNKESTAYSSTNIVEEEYSDNEEHTKNNTVVQRRKSA